MLGNPLLLGDDGYQISRSVRLRSSATAFFSKATVGTSTNALWTFSVWVKRGALGTNMELLSAASGSTNYSAFFFNSTDNLVYQERSGATTYTQLITTQVFRDPSAWYHIVLAYDSANATAANRVRIFVNGAQVTSFSTATYPSTIQNSYISWTGSTLGDFIGRFGGAATEYLDGYITEVNFVTGQALTPSSFGESDAITGVWKPKKYVGTYGTNGFYLNFSDNSAATAAAIGADSSGNGNNWTPNNISVTAGVTYDSMLDVPTPWADGGNGRGNYCVLNGLSKVTTAAVVDGNIGTTSSSSQVAIGSVGMDSGKWYWECQMTGSSSVKIVGVYGTTNSSATTGAALGASIGIRFDRDAGTLDYTLDGISWTSIATGLTSTTYFPYFQNTTAGAIITANFGQRPFTYTPPTGYKALNTLNLPEPTIKAGNKYFDATLYTGNGATQNIVNAGGFQPDLVWLKGRSAATGNALYDAVRGVLNYLGSESTAGESTIAGTVTAFNFNGFSIGNQAGTNSNAATYVGWQWKEGATQGFDIVTYTGTGVARTLAHTLGVAPSMMIVKQRSAGASDWAVYHSSMLATRRLSLNTTGAQNTTSAAWNNTAPTSSEFTVGTGGDVNANGNTYVAYLFAEVSGFSKFGSYTGNGSADGPFVFCGFRPKWVMFKNINTGTTNWSISDTARSPDNVSDEYLLANTSGAEVSSVTVDLLSNGFKLRNTGTWYNTNGDTYIFAAFAENPFKYSLAR